MQIDISNKNWKLKRGTFIAKVGDEKAKMRVGQIDTQTHRQTYRRNDG